MSPLEWCPASLPGPTYAVVDNDVKLQDLCRALGRFAAEYGGTFSADLLEHLRHDRCDAKITLEDGRCYGPRSDIKILGVQMGNEGGSRNVVMSTG